MSTREQILEAATELFAERGFARTSIRQVAERADANSALIYYYFGSKAELYRAVLDAPASEMHSMLERAAHSSATAADQLRRFVDAWVPFILTRRGLVALVFRSLAGGDVELGETMRAQILPNATVLMRIVEEGIARGEFRPVDPALAVGSLVGTVLFYMLSTPVAAEALGIEMDEGFARRLAEHTSGIFLEGIRAR